MSAASTNLDQPTVMSFSIPKWLADRLRDRVETDKEEYRKEPDPEKDSPTASAYVVEGLMYLVKTNRL